MVTNDVVADTQTAADIHNSKHTFGLMKRLINRRNQHLHFGVSRYLEYYIHNSSEIPIQLF